jgi:branched-chain amino acid transport system substrate-binding protein
MTTRILKAALLAATLLAPLTAMPSSAAAEDVAIGAAAPMTGPRALLGRNFRQGVDMAIEEVNAAGGVLGGKLSVQIEDDQGDNPNAAINAVTKLMQVEKVPLMLGPHYSVAQLATQKSYCDGSIVSVTGASGVPVTQNGCGFVIRVRANDIIQSKALVEYARTTLGIDKIGILYINDDFGKAGADRVVLALKSAGLEPVTIETHNTQDKDFSAQLAKLQNAGAKLTILWTHDTEAALIVRQATQLGLDMRFAGSTSLSEPSFVKLAGPAAEGVISANDFVASNPDERIQTFGKAYEAKYNMGPEIWAAAYYDATHLAARAINAAGSTDPAKIREAFKSIEHEGLLGSYRCEENGDCNHQIHIVTVENGVPTVKSTVKF